MAETHIATAPRSDRIGLWIGAVIAAAVFVVGLFGGLTEAAGYALLLASAVLLLGSVVLFGVFILSHRFSGDALRRGFSVLFVLGAAFYVFGVCALGGYFTYEALQGRVALRWIVFGPAVLAAIVILDAGVYRILIEKNLPSFRRWRQVISREASDPAAMRRTLVDEVVLQRSLFSVSRFRWLRHTLIFWGFMLLFATELFAVLLREILPSFGLTGLWAEGHPLRLLFDVSFEVFGLAVLVGCVLALAFRVVVNGTPQQKYTDTPTALFLFVVVLSGFVIEALRIGAGGAGDYAALSFVGYALAGMLGGETAAEGPVYEALWYLHVIGSCAFIAYVPVKRLAHSCATPMGRLMNSQRRLLEAKRQQNLRGLFLKKQV